MVGAGSEPGQTILENRAAFDFLVSVGDPDGTYMPEWMRVLLTDGRRSIACLSGVQCIAGVVGCIGRWSCERAGVEMHSSGKNQTREDGTPSDQEWYPYRYPRETGTKHRSRVIRLLSTDRKMMNNKLNT